MTPECSSEYSIDQSFPCFRSDRLKEWLSNLRTIDPWTWLIRSTEWFLDPDREDTKKNQIRHRYDSSPLSMPLWLGYFSITLSIEHTPLWFELLRCRYEPVLFKNKFQNWSRSPVRFVAAWYDASMTASNWLSLGGPKLVTFYTNAWGQAYFGGGVMWRSWFLRFGCWVRTGHYYVILRYISRSVPLALSFFLSLFSSSALYLSSAPPL